MRIVGPEQAPPPVPEADAAIRGRAGSPSELSLWDFIDPLVNSWWAIAGIAMIVGGLAFAMARFQRPVYEATAVVRIAESKTGDQVEAVRAENFRPLLENRTIAAELVREFGIVSEPSWRFLAGGSRPLAADAFLRNHVNVEQVTGTNLLRLSVRLGDAERAAKVANELVDRGVALNRRISQQEVVEARDYIKTQLDEALKRVEALKVDLLALKQSSQVDALRADTQGALALRTKLLQLQAEIEYERAFLSTSEAELEAGEQLLTTRRTIDRNAALMEAAKEQSAGGSVLGLELSEQQVNEAYSSLQEQIAESRAKLAGLERQRRMLVEDKRLDNSELPGLSMLYGSEMAIARLQAEYDMALKVYTDLSTRYEDARIRVGSRGAQLQLVDPAVVPSTRISPRVVATTQLGLVLGLLLGCLLFLGRHFLHRHRVGV